MEETIGYEALFTADEWNSIVLGERSGPDDWGSPKEGEPKKHSVFIGNPPGQHDGNEEHYELECDVCDYVGAADTEEEAQAIARLHESFVATLVEKWSVDR